MIKVFRNKSRIDKIGFCNRGKDKDLEFACLILSCGRKIVSTMSYSEEDKISPGEFLQNRIDDFNYCMNLNNITTLQAEFELYDDETHSINKTCTNGYNGEHFAKVGRDDMSERDERSIGFIQGVVYAAGLIKEYQLSSEQLLKERVFPWRT